jgi:catechol 2,3-dioxygenase-like lactoylglutathione lyase family enzyme
MIENVSLNHIALIGKSEKNSKLFFSNLLGLSLVKKFTLSKILSNQIFKINETINVLVYKNQEICFEIFLQKYEQKDSYHHICIDVNNKEEIIEKCKINNIEYFKANKENKQLLFIKDLAGNLFEVKEKNIIK